MEPLPIIEIEVSIQSTPGFCDGAIVVEVHLLVLDTSPEPFDEDIVEHTISPVPANGNLCRLKSFCKRIGGELASPDKLGQASITVKNRRLRSTDHFFQSRQTEEDIR